MSQGPVLARGPGGRLRNNINKTNNKKTSRTDESSTISGGSSVGYNNIHHPSRSAGYSRSKPQSPPLGGRVGLYVAPRLLDTTGSHGNSENMAPFRYHRSARAGARRQMAIECGLKSLPVHTKWSPAGRIKTALDGIDQGSITQNQVYLQAPDGNVNVRRGLRFSSLPIKRSQAYRSKEHWDEKFFCVENKVAGISRNERGKQTNMS
ncbi:hypothetical protein ElyMa_004123900 [Elysia marginata]|uniref:Uncharacterized protein n=1 Tax=Elysia marginata TaxID=1093978 RepID=A0AAV4GD38_9GAST|nr:hypothetical protein ElyMa_004123900 [Elysia marginata]